MKGLRTKKITVLLLLLILIMVDALRPIPIEMKENKFKTPLYSAAWARHPETITLLLERLADMEARDLSDHTPLHTAAFAGQMEIATLLLERSVNAEAKNNFGMTPLHAATVRVRDEIAEVNATIELLLDNIAEIDSEAMIK